MVPANPVSEAVCTENLMFSLNATVPIFLLMLVGYVLHEKTRLLSDRFADDLNKYVFQIALPVQMFKSMAAADFHTVWNGKMVVFCCVVSLLSILVMLFLSRFLRDRSIRAEFVQAGYRGSQALLGGALLQNIYGNTRPLALILIGAVPLYNIAAVLVLTLMTPEGGHLDRRTMKKAVRGVVTNPLILGILVGLVWSLLKIPQPAILQRAVDSVAATATPIGLLALGACINWKKAVGCWKPTVVCCAFKLVIFTALFLPFAVWMGFRGEILVAVVIMLASPATVSCFSMARSMGHPGVLTSSAVMLTTVGSAFTFTFWLYLLKTLALI